jgi:hypothetical protein
MRMDHSELSSVTKYDVATISRLHFSWLYACNIHETQLLFAVRNKLSQLENIEVEELYTTQIWISEESISLARVSSKTR